MPAPIIPGAESISITDGTNGGVLLLHGYMGTVQTVRDLALAFARAGFAVEAPLLPGHGTSVEDMAETRWSDYVRCAEDAYARLAQYHRRIFVGGICTGGNLAAWQVTQHPETIAGLIVINGVFKMPRHWNMDFLDELVKANRQFFPWWRGKSVEDPLAPPLITYDQTPIKPMLSLKAARTDICQRLGEIHCPVLVFTSMRSPEFALDDEKQWFEEVSGPVEHILLERSNHVATLDYDKGIIEDRSVAFALEIVKGERSLSSKGTI